MSGMRRATILASGFAFAMVAHAASNLRSVAPEQLGHWWLMSNSEIAADVPYGGRNLSAPTCTTVIYTIGADGQPHGIDVVREMPAGDLGQVAASAVSSFRYPPAPGNPAREPVRTWTIMPFNLPDDPVARARITAPCRLADFPKGYPHS